MHVQFFKRGDDLKQAVKEADVVVDTLSSNPDTYQLLNDEFFDAMKADACFVSVTRSEVMDVDALFQALDSGRLRGAACDCGGILVGDTQDPLYIRLLNHPKIIVTPHIAYNTDMSFQLGADIMIDNVEAYLNGHPQHLLT